MKSFGKRFPMSTPSLNIAITSAGDIYRVGSGRIMSIVTPMLEWSRNADVLDVPYCCRGGECSWRITGDVHVGCGLAAPPGTSTKKSEGEKHSGLLCRDSAEAFDRGAEGGFLGTGRIHGGRVFAGEDDSARGAGSSGIPVTETMSEWMSKVNALA
jgi:hypothetical protein